MMPPPPDAWVPPGCADLTNPDVFLDGPPHDTFARLRAEAPVGWHPEAEGGGFWCVTRWQDEHPGERARLQADLSLLPTAVEEMLRWVTPVMHFRRTAERDVELGGRQIRAGDKVVMWYVSANRDEAVFDQPERFDVTRAPNDHLAFGFGSHFCLGASLAQLEARVLFEELFARYPGIAPAGPIARMRANHIAGIKHMPVRLV
jgi:cytochrome P450